MPDKNRGSMDSRFRYIGTLNENIIGLDAKRVRECKEAVWQSYQASTLIPQIAIISEKQYTEAKRFRSIGLRSAIEIRKFNDRTYIWTPYFSDVGRAIASGEQKYIQQRIVNQVRADEETISRSEPDFRMLSEHIKNLVRNNLDPDTLLAPIQVFVDFVESYGSNMQWPTDRPEQLTIYGTTLKVFWSHSYAQLRSFLIFNSKAGIWHVIPEQGTNRPLIIAIGNSERCLGKVEYWVETLVRYQIVNDRAFSRISLSR